MTPTGFPFINTNSVSMTNDDKTNSSEKTRVELSANAEALKNAWQSTLAEMDSLAEEYEFDGWKTTTVPAGHTAPKNEESGKTDRWGLVFTVPDNYGKKIKSILAGGDFPEYDVYRKHITQRVFLVVVYLDSASEQALLVSGSYQMTHADDLIERTKKEGEVYSYLRTIDGTQLAAFRHHTPEKFFSRI